MENMEDTIFEDAKNGNKEKVKKFIDEGGFWEEALEGAVDEPSNMEMVKFIISLNPEYEDEFISIEYKFCEKYYKWLKNTYPDEYKKEFDDAVQKNIEIHYNSVMEWNRLIFKHRNFVNIEEFLENNKENFMLEFKIKITERFNIYELKSEISTEDVSELYRYMFDCGF